MTRLAFCHLLLAVMALPALADDPPTPEPDKPGKEWRKQFDKDGDGKLNKEERKAAREAWKKQRGKHQGKKDRSVCKHCGAPLPAPPHRRLKRLDTDGDGKLSEAERKAAREAQEKKRAERRARLLEQYDTDGDGKLSEAERKAMREAQEKKREERLLKRFDKNGDGKLDAEERKAAEEAARKRRGCKHCRKFRQKPGRRVGQRFRQQFDKDGDGKLNEEERRAAREARKNHRRNRGGQGEGDPRNPF